MITCCRCGADLSQPPHSKLYWQGVPRAAVEHVEHTDGLPRQTPCPACPDGKGDLCNPCHDVWLAERAKPRHAETCYWLRAQPGMDGDEASCCDCGLRAREEIRYCAHREPTAGGFCPDCETSVLLKPDRWGNSDGTWKKGDKFR